MAIDDDAPLDDDILEDDLVDVGPFDPPIDYAFEEELQGDPPRLRLPELKQGRYARGQRRKITGLVIAGLLCWFFGQWSMVQTWGIYFLPLAYLSWIGVALLVVTFATFLVHRFARGPYRYVEEGIPIVVRIRRLELRTTAIVNGQPTGFRYFATIEWRDLDSGELRIGEVSSNDILAGLKDAMTTTYRVGDYATAVYLPSDPSRNLRLHGFLDLRAGLGLVRSDDGPESNPLTQGIAIVVGFAALGAVFFAIYAVGRFAPIAISPKQVFSALFVGGVALGGPTIACFALKVARDRRRNAERIERAASRGEAIEPMTERKRGWFGDHGVFLGLLIAAGAMVLGGMAFYAACLTANALLDTSPARRRPVKILDMVAVTHRGVFREYKIEYRFLDADPAKHTFLSTPAEMATFPSPSAVAEVHDGRFGWPWVKALIPVEPGMLGNGPGP